MNTGVLPRHVQAAEALVREARRHDGRAPVDLEAFWADQEIARSDPWADDCPQLPLGIMMSHECLFAELGIPEDWHRLVHDPAWRAEMSGPYNDKAEEIVGRRLLNENPPGPAGENFPGTKGLNDVFEARNVWQGNSYWLHQSAETPDELAALLDRVEARLEDLRSFILPENWDAEKQRLTALGKKPGLYRGQRGPVTFACSVYGPENLIFLIMDRPDLAGRFRDLILRTILEIARIKDEEAGYAPDEAPHGWYWCDDNCVLLNPEMYEFFGAPILQGVFDRYSPDPGDLRGQHSDSDMNHLLPILGRLGLNSTNFGPNVMVDEIRAHLPRAVICGQLAPFTFSRNDEVGMVAELLRDFERIGPGKGLVFATAGSINNGSRLTGMRLLMAAIQRHCRY